MMIAGAEEAEEAPYEEPAADEGFSDEEYGGEGGGEGEGEGI
jgi:hypothetical protein